ncbi:MAG: roadblock/LC7 domain-containing protein [Armatimonadetes bacterium]|nr:roadblock/LC7 domain-containing protein [Armatimonadota bacterium]
MEQARAVLEAFISVDGVDQAAVVDPKGIVLSQVQRQEEPWVVSLATASIESSLALGEALEKGELVQSQVECEGGSLLVEPLARFGFLVLKSSPGANLGRIRYEIKKQKKLLEGAGPA